MGQRRYGLLLAFTLVFSGCKAAIALEFQPGVGVGVEHTDNAALSPDSEVEDLITVGYVGARLSENEGPLKYDASAAFNKNNYVRDTFEDQRYFNLTASANWDMIKQRFNWFLSDSYRQTQVVALGSNTPDNIQDSNVFNLGAKIRLPISARQSFSLTPMFSQYYYEVLLTDSKQHSLSANWNYQMFRLTSIGLSLSGRKINYTEANLLGQSIEDTTFTSMGLTFNGQRMRSSFSGSLGSTNVEREGGDETSGFSGFLNWFVDLSSHSKFEVLLSTDLTDTSSVALSAAGDPASGGEDVQVTTDIIRNSVFNLNYKREDASLRTSVFARYHKLTYNENPLDRVVRAFGVSLKHPVTQLLSSGAYVNYNRTKQLDTARLDEYYTVGGNLKYRFSRKLSGVFDLKYRTKESTLPSQNYNEFSVFASLVYGFGDVGRPSRSGGY